MTIVLRGIVAITLALGAATAGRVQERPAYRNASLPIERRVRDLAPYRIDGTVLALADPDGVAMHCLPAHVGEEITPDVLYGPRCLAWEQAENRLHTQKALMALVIR